MQFTKRACTTMLGMVVAASVALAPALMEPASAAPGRAAVTQECASAQTAHALAQSAKARAHRKLVKARKALRSAKHSHRPAKIRKAKRHLKAAKKRYAVRKHNERVQAARMGYACSAPNSSARAAGTGMKLDLLAIATGQGGKLIDPTELSALLEGLLPGVTAPGGLSQSQLTALLSGFNSGTPSLDDLTVLLGGAFSTDQLRSLLGGSPDPSLVLALATNIVNALSGLTSGAVPVPSSFSTTTPQDIIDTVTGVLGPVTTTVTTTTSTTTTSGGTLLCTLGICI